MANQSTGNSEETRLIFDTIVPAVTGEENDNDTLFITDNGLPTGNITETWKFDIETQAWYQLPAGDTCPGPMTRAQLRALRTAGGLSKDCHYVITNPSANGNLDVEKIILHAVDESTLSMQAGILTSHNINAYQGVYDIDQDDVLEVTDHLENKVISNASILNFPFGIPAVNGNTVMNRANVIYNSGNFTNNVVDTDATVTTSGNTNRNHFEASSNTTINSGDFLENRVEGDATVISSTTGDVDNNIFRANSNTTINTGNFDQNEVHSDATVLINGGVAIPSNHFYSRSNTTINSGDFRDNQVQSDATVTSNTTGDIDKNTFGNNSNSVFSGTSNFDNNVVNADANVTMTGGTVVNSKFEQLSNYVMSGGVLRESTVGQDADVTIISGDNYENVWGASTIYRQVGTGIIRYSTIEGTTTWINGNTNVSNVNSYVSTVNTTGSTGTISNSTLNRAYAINMQNIPSLTITDSTISNYGQVSANNATRLYMYRSTVNDGSRILVSNGSRLDMSYTNLDSYSYIQSTGNGGITYANYCNLSSYGYMRNLTTNTNRFDRCTVTAQANMRFDGDASGGRIYYCHASGGATIYQTTGSVNCYMYYVTASSLAQVYSQNAVNLRMYYSNATSYSYLRSINNPATHYMYYCNADARGFVQALNNTGTIRMYAVSASSQSIAEIRGSTGNLYYSSFSAYFYLYLTRTAGTSLGLFGQGRRTVTATNPVLVTPNAVGTSWSNL